MSKPIVLVIHGMGTHSNGGLKLQINNGLNEAAKNFGLSDFNFSDKVELVEFNYSEFLDEIRQRSADHASSMSDHLALLQGKGLSVEVVSQLTGFLSDFDEDEMLYTHWMDVLYYGVMFWGEQIRVDFAKAINDVMIKANMEERDVHIIAHSLGTSVAHDTLAKLFREDVDLTSQVPGLDIAKFRIKSLWTVANVSRLTYLLNNIADPNTSIVNATPDGCCDYLVNIRNTFDPFTWFKTYQRDDGHSRQLEVDTIRYWNTHDIKEYMATPLVSAYLFSFLFSIELSEEQWEKGVASHSESSVNKPVSELKEAMGDLRNQPDLEGKIDTLKQVFSTAKAVKDRLEAIIEEANDE
ncbi:hypothetical protein [Vibrio sp. 10N.261.55.A7]|uniref:hypothetical protein n=1 Tax=Vibrio sp. 10N.261.55.A7 TaxID=1880851 RepID=UPI000C82DEA1|nr:hypothetical protein [Vibrio sp. 10N.261.55.A7]PMJ91534.1 hypothetical protein BCU12_09580 [Vibrio sp. 10N.261.55.A7]